MKPKKMIRLNGWQFRIFRKLMKVGCCRCGIKLKTSDFFHIEQLPEKYFLRYRIFCDECGNKEIQAGSKEAKDGSYRYFVEQEAQELGLSVERHGGWIQLYFGKKMIIQKHGYYDMNRYMVENRAKIAAIIAGTE